MEMRPDHLAVFIQGDADACSLAALLDVPMVSVDWGGAPLYATELNLQKADQPLMEANALLDRLEREGYPPKWITTFAPGLEPGITASNCYVSRKHLMQDLESGAPAG